MDLSSEENETLRNNTFERSKDIKNFYNELDNVCTNYSNCTRNSINSTSDEHAIKLYKKFDYNIFKFILTSESSYQNFPKDINKRCTYFKYWFYDQIIRYNLDDEKVKHIIDPLKYGKDIIEFSIENVVNPRKCYIHIRKLDDIKKMKVLYDFLESYDVNAKKSNINEKICKNNFKNYLADIISDYNQLTSCNSESTEYCKEIEECKRIYKIDELSILHCNEDQPQSFSETGLKDGDSSLRTAVDSSLHSQPEDGVSSFSSDLPSEGIIPYTGVTTVSSLAVTSVIFFILYKVTPLGILLRRSFQNVTNILPNINENESQELLDQVSVSDSVNMDNISNYIAYHPS
ncbi:PIR protein [Plasmodium ovale]|uniref:PIR Superfamily Protein n=2 Tax=Plasmodium ovale TaxID=36330 RepID=A0A1A8XCK3_PLAOA|nr:PIR Superfamily Protein [Plasmodium ovale curtisi]SBT01578.1 PIR Superfamily Protein [Plasmodium ovale curtisi]SBT85046.1 PIR protein [Plasmodium ovale]